MREHIMNIEKMPAGDGWPRFLATKSNRYLCRGRLLLVLVDLCIRPKIVINNLTRDMIIATNSLPRPQEAVGCAMSPAA